MKRTDTDVVGKTITGIITSPSHGGRPGLVMLQFSDGSCFEFVSEGAMRALRRQAQQRQAANEPAPESACRPPHAGVSARQGQLHILGV